VILVNIKHARQLKYCVRGCKTFCEKYNIDFKKFVKEGVDAEEFLKTGDAMALKLVEHVKKQEDN